MDEGGERNARLVRQFDDFDEVVEEHLKSALENRRMGQVVRELSVEPKE